jgi:hypothetical protein
MMMSSVVAADTAAVDSSSAIEMIGIGLVSSFRYQKFCDT